MICDKISEDSEGEKWGESKLFWGGGERRSVAKACETQPEVAEFDNYE